MKTCMNLHITLQDSIPVQSRPVEMVERKGKGHPDTICDAIADEIGNALSRFYLQRFGCILHHNVDKALLQGGAARADFGGGEVLRPIEIYLAGRATFEFNGVTVPVEEIAVETARSWLGCNLHALDPERHVRLHCLIRPSSRDLVDLYLRGGIHGRPLANDTSTGVGYAPLNELESIVLQVERHLNSAALKATHPEVGEDIKVMGVRLANRITLTIGCALISRHVVSGADYHAKKATVATLAWKAAREFTNAAVEVSVNAADGESLESLYLTVTGTSAEAGDDGEVGRGNRANGLITPYRPMTMEAVAGKNPISHVGKLYNLGAIRIAQAIAAEVKEVQEACCWLTSQIGRNIDDPQAADVQLRLRDGAVLQDVEPRIIALVGEHMAALPDLWRELITGSLTVW